MPVRNIHAWILYTIYHIAILRNQSRTFGLRSEPRRMHVYSGTLLCDRNFVDDTAAFLIFHRMEPHWLCTILYFHKYLRPWQEANPDQLRCWAGLSHGCLDLHENPVIHADFRKLRILGLNGLVDFPWACSIFRCFHNRDHFLCAIAADFASGCWRRSSNHWRIILQLKV